MVSCYLKMKYNFLCDDMKFSKTQHYVQFKIHEKFLHQMNQSPLLIKATEVDLLLSISVIRTMESFFSL